MTDFSPHVVIPLLIWGSLVALDLVSLPQAMFSRPLVAGTVAGWIAGDVEAGLRTGVLFELFALDSKIDVQPTADAFEPRANVLKAIQGHILAKAVYGGLFRRPQ